MFDKSACRTCPLNTTGGIAGTYSYVTASPDASVVVVTPSVPKAQELKKAQLLIDEFDGRGVELTYATKCTGDISGKKQKPKRRAEQEHCFNASDEWEADERVYVCMGAEAVAFFTKEKIAKPQFGRVTEVTGIDGRKYKLLPSVTLPQVFYYKESQDLLLDHIDLALDAVEGRAQKFFTPNVTVLETPEEIFAYIEKLKNMEPSYIACDTETNSLNPFLATFELLMMSFSYDKNEGVTVIMPGEFAREPWTQQDERRLFEELASLFRDTEHRWVFHNAQFDIKVLAQVLDIPVEVFKGAQDTLLLAHFVNENRMSFSLKPLAREELKYEVWDQDVKDWFKLPMAIKLAAEALEKIEEEVEARYATHKSLTKGLEKRLADAKKELFDLREQAHGDLAKMKHYAAVDASATFGLFDHFMTIIENDEWLFRFYKDFLQYYPMTLVEIEYTGLQLDEDYFYDYKEATQNRLDKITQAFFITYFKEHSGEMFLKDFESAYTEIPTEDKEARKVLRTIKKDLKAKQDKYGSCGTLEEVLSHELFEENPEVTKVFVEKYTEVWKLRTDHIQQLVTKHFDLPILAKTEKGTPSFTADVMDEYIEHTEGSAQSFFKLYKMHTDLSKNLSTYLEGFLPFVDPDNFVLHGNFLATGTRTGRLSSREPNLQNVKKTEAILKMFVSRYGKEGVIIQSDYSQAELRMLAVVSQDSGFLDAYRLGIDLHRLTAAKAFQLPIEHLFDPQEAPQQVIADLAKHVETWQRNVAKTLNFGIVYGMQSRGLAAQTGYTEEDAEAFINVFFMNAPGVQKWIKMTELFLVSNGFVLSPFGRKRRMPNFVRGPEIMKNVLGPDNPFETHENFLEAMLDSNGFSADSAHDMVEWALRKLSRDVPINMLRKDLRAGVNAPIQGGASDLNVRAAHRMNELLRKRKMQTRIVQTVHDSVVFDAPKEEAREIIKLWHKIATQPFPKSSTQDILRGYSIVPFEIEVSMGESQASQETLNLSEYLE